MGKKMMTIKQAAGSSAHAATQFRVGDIALMADRESVKKVYHKKKDISKIAI